MASKTFHIGFSWCTGDYDKCLIKLCSHLALTSTFSALNPFWNVERNVWSGRVPLISAIAGESIERSTSSPLSDSDIVDNEPNAIQFKSVLCCLPLLFVCLGVICIVLNYCFRKESGRSGHPNCRREHRTISSWHVRASASGAQLCRTGTLPHYPTSYHFWRGGGGCWGGGDDSSPFSETEAKYFWSTTDTCSLLLAVLPADFKAILFHFWDNTKSIARMEVQKSPYSNRRALVK